MSFPRTTDAAIGLPAILSTDRALSLLSCAVSPLRPVGPYDGLSPVLYSGRRSHVRRGLQSLDPSLFRGRLFRIAQHTSHHETGWCAEGSRRRRFDAKPSEQPVHGCSLHAPTRLARSSHRQTSSAHPMTDGSSPLVVEEAWPRRGATRRDNLRPDYQTRFFYNSA